MGHRRGMNHRSESFTVVGGQPEAWGLTVGGGGGGHGGGSGADQPT